MELFIPSLLFLLVGVAIAYFIIPTIAPTMLISGSVIVLIAALYIHYSRFGVMEYERATWQHNLKKYANWVVVAAILLGAYGFYAMNQTSSFATSPALPEITMPTMSGGGYNALLKSASSRVNELLRKGRISV